MFLECKEHFGVSVEDSGTAVKNVRDLMDVDHFAAYFIVARLRGSYRYDRDGNMWEKAECDAMRLLGEMGLLDLPEEATVPQESLDV